MAVRLWTTGYIRHCNIRLMATTSVCFLHLCCMLNFMYPVKAQQEMCAFFPRKALPTTLSRWLIHSQGCTQDLRRPLCVTLIPPMLPSIVMVNLLGPGEVACPRSKYRWQDKIQTSGVLRSPGHCFIQLDDKDTQTHTVTSTCRAYGSHTKRVAQCCAVHF